MTVPPNDPDLPLGFAEGPAPPAMNPDRALAAKGYRFRSRHHLSDRDLVVARGWLPGTHPLFEAISSLRNQRVTRRKELYETIFVLDRLAPELRHMTAMCEVAAGHGLLGLFASLTHPGLQRVLLVDSRQPLCYDSAREIFAALHPFLKRRTAYAQRSIKDLETLPRGYFVVGVHACGALTDHLARLARSAGAPFAVAPCCEGRNLLPKDMEGRDKVPGDAIPRIVNAIRVKRWRSWGYDVEERRIPWEVTERPRLFVCHPHGTAPPKRESDRRGDATERRFAGERLV